MSKTQYFFQSLCRGQSWSVSFFLMYFSYVNKTHCLIHCKSVFHTHTYKNTRVTCVTQHVPAIPARGKTCWDHSCCLLSILCWNLFNVSALYKRWCCDAALWVHIKHAHKGRFCDQQCSHLCWLICGSARYLLLKCCGFPAKEKFIFTWKFNLRIVLAPQKQHIFIL